MHWILLGVIAIALIIMSARYPKIAFSLLALLIAIVSAVIVTSTDSGFVARQKLPPEDVKIENPVMIPAYADSYRFNARLVNNNNEAILKETTLSITISDCSDQSETYCQVIGQTEQRFTVTIPPGQARDVERMVSFDAASPESWVKWTYKVTATRS